MSSFFFNVLVVLCLWMIPLSSLYGNPYLERGLDYFYRGEFHKVNSFLIKIKDSHPQNYHLIHAILAYQDNDCENAKKHLSQVEPSPSIDPYIRYYTVQIQIAKGDLVSAEMNARKEFKHNEDYFLHSTLMTISKDLYEEERYHESRRLAFEVYREAHGKIKQTACQYLIKNAVALQNKKQATRYYRKYILAYDDSDTHQTLFQIITHQFSELKTIDQVLSKKVYWRYCQNLYDSKAYETCFQHLFQFQLKYPMSLNSIDTLTLLGKACYKKGDYKTAIIYFERIKRHFGHDAQQAEIIYLNGRAYKKRRQYASAMKEFKILMTSASHPIYSPAAYYENYLCAKKINTTIDTSLYIAQVKQQYPDATHLNDLIWDIGWVAFKQKKWSLADNIFSQYSTSATKSSVKSRIAYFRMLSLKQLGLKKEVERLQKENVSLYPLSYYTYRTTQDGDTKTAAIFTKDEMLNTSYQAVETSLMPLLKLGVGDVLSEVIKYKQVLGEENQALKTYGVCFIYHKTHQYDRLWKTIYSGMPKANSKTMLPREFLTLLYPRAYWREVQRYAKKYKIDPYLLLAVMREESRFNPTVCSRSNALGLMQLMPNTGREVSRQLKETWKGKDSLFWVSTNIRYGAYYLSRLMRRFDKEYVWVLSAYNAGPTRTRRWQKTLPKNDIGKLIPHIPYTETKKYVERVLRSYWVYTNLYSANQDVVAKINE